MQFIQNGPDIPDALLQAHEEGRVVFFCGAGISYPAGLPGFSRLVSKIYDAVGERPNAIEKTAIKAGQFDTTIGLLEARFMGGRESVRRAVANILRPDLLARHATSTHEALLTLALCRNGRTRLITTNFDCLFEEVIQRKGANIQRFQAPLLPVPKNRWDGLIYLHGLLPATLSASELDRLVLSSGDFGLAYLIERWAARFVSELFRNYTVCFVGYSINDPVLRYMMDALAADRLLGESPPQMFAFGSHAKGKEKEAADEWLAKNVTPILYREHNRHAFLHKTIRAWAATYRDGVQGKERIVSDYAMTLPTASTRQDDYVGRMLWALSHDSGLPAKRFAEFNPAPSLDWLGPLSDERFKQSDLPRFGVAPLHKQDDKLVFGLTRRPAPYTHTPWMMLTAGGSSNWDKVMTHIGDWLMRHLNDPELALWLANPGGQLHDRLVWLIECELDKLAKLEREGNTAELTRIRANSPNAIPGPLMRTVWRLLLTNRVKSPLRDNDLYRWKDRFNRDGLTTTMRLDLRALLTPKIFLKKPFRWGGNGAQAKEPSRVKDLVDWELVLATDYVHLALNDLMQSETWCAALPVLLEDVQQLLRDALDLLCELGEANDRSDRSHWDLPSIKYHWQNRGFHDWVSLIELLRDAWLAVRANDTARATRIAQSWFDLPYPTFKRLALFAASQDGCISPKQWVDWLLSDGAWWLWAADTKREVCRLLVQQGQHLIGATKGRLESAILAGPPHEVLMGQPEPDWWLNHVIEVTWLRLAKLNTSDIAMGASAAARLAELSNAYPQWQLAANERDEFSHWMSGTGDPDYEDSRDVDIAPNKRQDLVQWLTKPTPERRPFYEDTWRVACQKHPLNCLFALADLAKQENYPPQRWSDALYAWSNGKNMLRMWRYVAPIVQTLPDTVLLEIAQGLTWWMEVASKSINRHQEILLDLCRRVLALPIEADQGNRLIRDGVEIFDPVSSAINHPIGHVTQTLINLCFKQSPNDNDRIPAELEPLLTALCDVREGRFRHGRVLLGSRLIAFFRVDRPWTEQYLLPLLGWSNPIEAKAVWEGFLWSPRLYQPLLTAFKAQLLDCANHYADLGKHRQQYAIFLTYAALGPTEGYTVEEFRTAVSTLPQEGLEKSAQALSQALESAADQREDYWKNRVQPFWQQIWPKSRDLATPRIAESLIRLVIAARGEFPAALAAVQDWLKPIEHPHYVIHLLAESGLCKQFPKEALILLNAVIADQKWAPRELGQCLDEISHAGSNLAEDARYLRLREYSRRRGM